MDDKVVQEIFDQFNKFFTLEQVKQTLISNQNDKLKTLQDLKFKESKCNSLTQMTQELKGAYIVVL